ncbi:MAG: hypothetical protein K2M50_09275, partial [Treponemataceae bacterium]|nr:hypothetical protein [Treponemataceae bacterium]
APEFVDDGFGGKNGQVTIADMIGGDDGSTGKAKINFLTWSMIGVQGNYLTQSVSDPSKKGLDLDAVTLGFKSYNKFAGNFLPNCPVYIEIALAETDMEDAGHQGNGGNRRNYIYRRDVAGKDSVSAETGLKNLVSGLLTNPISYLAQTNNNIDTGDFAAGPGTNPFLGHLKFGFNTPYINYYTGFNYAKADTRDAITWTTIGSNFDAGYEHSGGFHVFSLGDKPAAAFQELTGLRLDIGFAPNKSADRRGYKYGYWGWAGVIGDNWAVDFQTNGMYDGGYAFYDPIEHDFILGGKAKFDNISFALQGLLATHQKSSADIISDNIGDGAKYAGQSMGSGPDSISQVFGHSTDVFYRDTNLGVQNLAANAQFGYNDSLFGVNVEYRMRGAQASMLFVREDQDNGTFDLSEQLGVLNSQRVAFTGYVNPIDMLRIDLGLSAEMPLEFLRKNDEIVQKWAVHSGVWDSWYAARCASDMAPLFGVVGGAEFAIKPAVTVNITDGLTLGAYADMYVNTYRIEKKSFGEEWIGDKYGASDSQFLFKFAGLSLAMKFDADAIKGVNVFYGLDNSNDARLFNTLIGQAEFKYGFKATLGFGIKTIKDTEAGNAFNEDENNVFSFALGLSRQFQSLKKPTIYAQFVYNTDPFNGFGSGQEQLRMDRANVGSYWVDGVMQGQGDGGTGQRSPDAVDWYDGRAALRLGIRWDI